jgi:hypothetical protein
VKGEEFMRPTRTILDTSANNGDAVPTIAIPGWEGIG